MAKKADKKKPAKSQAPRNTQIEHTDTSAWAKAPAHQVLMSELRAAESIGPGWAMEREGLIDYFSGLGGLDLEDCDEFGVALGRGLISSATSQGFDVARALLEDRMASMDDWEKKKFLAGPSLDLIESPLQWEVDKQTDRDMPRTDQSGSEVLDLDGPLMSSGTLIDISDPLHFGGEVDSLEKIIRHRSQALGSGGSVLVSASDRSTQALTDAIGDWRVNQARGWLNSSPAQDKRSGAAGRLLFDLLNNKAVSRSVLAEAFARLDMYVMSGHAERDFDSAAPLPEDPSQRMAVEFMRSLAHRFDTMGVPPDQEETEYLGACLSQRMDAVSICLKLDKNGVASQVPDDKKTKASFDFFSGRTQGSGIVDVVMRDASDPSLIHVGVVTSLKDTKRQADQISKHAGGIEQGISANPPRPGFQPGDRIGNITYYTDCLFPKDYQKSRFSKNFAQSVKASMRPEVDDEGLERLMDNGNLLLLFRGLNLINGNRNPDYIMKARHRRTGASSRPFDEQESGPKNAAAAARDIAQVIEALAAAFPSFRIANESKVSSVGEARVFMESLSDAFCGILRWYGSYDMADKGLDKDKHSACQEINEIACAQRQNLLKILAHCCAQGFCVKEAEEMCREANAFPGSGKIMTDSSGFRFVRGCEKIFSSAARQEKDRDERVAKANALVESMASSAPTEATKNAYVANARLLIVDAAGRFGPAALSAIEESSLVHFAGKIQDKETRTLVEGCATEAHFIRMVKDCFPAKKQASPRRPRLG